MIEIVNAILIKDGSALLALRSASRRTYPATWSFPGGHVERGETIPAALNRELMEEIGVTPRSQTYLATLEDKPSDRDALVNFHIFSIESWAGEPANLGDEHERLGWFSFQEAKNLPNLALDAYQGIFDKLIEKSAKP